ncbi:MAG: enoyl-CoA hydratase/isomerase family protein [Ideonella sp.]|nr:enoyl-CoA hydratase/isomerase family protein [Ideonella sp.]MBE7427350.1 enoyl-CoA hydratase/isomerase family protein [Ideonella sp.]MCC7459386.1 enoyl-CoA hydratase [Nitrospira sp.]
MPSELLTDRRAATLILTISDPATRNTLSPQVYEAGSRALAQVAADPTLRCVIVRGDGPHFCAGGDLHRLAAAREGPADTPHTNVERFHGFVRALRACPKPVIAAVEGHAAGGGCSLALACDLIVAARGARFTMSYGRAGLSPDGGGTYHLARALPRALALQLLWLPEPTAAERWHQWGLVNALCDDGQALAEALVWAERLGRTASNAVASAKALVESAGTHGLAAHLDDEREHFVANLRHDNAAEGLRAFFDKRSPRFS